MKSAYCGNNLPNTTIAPETKPSQNESSLTTTMFQEICQFWGAYGTQLTSIFEGQPLQNKV